MLARISLALEMIPGLAMNTVNVFIMKKLHHFPHPLLATAYSFASGRSKGGLWGPKAPHLPLYKLDCHIEPPPFFKSLDLTLATNSE